jgi:hypothetical protein
VTSFPARVLVRAGALLRPLGDRLVVHRRLADRRSNTPPASNVAQADSDADPASTVRGATARFIAFG